MATALEQQVIDYLKVSSESECSSMATVLKVSAATLSGRLKHMTDKGLIVRKLSRYRGNIQIFAYSLPLPGESVENLDPSKLPKSKKEPTNRASAKEHAPAEHLADSTAKLSEMSLPSIDEALKTAVEAAVQAIADRMIGEITDLVKIGLAKSMPGIAALATPAVERPPEKIVPREKLPKIVIVGLLNDQISVVKDEFSGFVDVVALPKNATTNAIKANCAYAAATFVMTGFVSHQDSRAAKENTKGDFFPVTGGMSALKNVIGKWYLATQNVNPA